MNFAKKAAGGTGLLFVVILGLQTTQDKPKVEQKPKNYTYARDIAPILDKYCESCHSSDEDNPSELYMDDYASMVKGGKHGSPVVAGKPAESSLYFKLLPDPPFGKQMPRGRKKITPEAVQMIHDWIQQGAKKE